VESVLCFQGCGAVILHRRGKEEECGIAVQEQVCVLSFYKGRIL